MIGGAFHHDDRLQQSDRRRGRGRGRVDSTKSAGGYPRRDVPDFEQHTADSVPLMGNSLTNIGSRPAAYGAAEWGLAITLAAIWGSAFLWIALGVDSMSPGVVAFGRVALGAAALATFSKARRTIDREDWPRIVAVAVLGNAGPALLFAQAETGLDSAVAGMITSGTPILTLIIASLLLRKLPGRAQALGIGIGFLGILLMAFPSLVGTHANPLGVALVFIGTIGYASNANIIVPLQQKYGGPAVILWALLVSSVLLAPLAVMGIDESEFTPMAVIAVLILGVVGTGVARALSATLAGRVGAPRMSTTTYLIPVVAIVLGVAFRDETVAPLAILGVGVVLIGAYWSSRAVPTH